MEAFPDESGHEPSTAVTSEALPVIGLESTLQATLDVGTLLVNDEPVSLPATIIAGDSIAIALTAPEDWAASTTATLTVGPLTRTFTASTRPESVTLLNLAFRNVTLAMPGEVYTTNRIRVRDIAEPLPVFMSNGAEVSINGGPWGPSATLADRDTIRIRMAASTASLGVAATAATIGGHDYPWTITTADLVSAPPTYAQVTFAPTIGADPDALITSPQASLRYAPAGYSVVRIIGGEGDPRFVATGSNGWSTGPRLIRNGAIIRIQARSAETALATRTANLAVGARNTSWALTTRDLIRTPNAFSFSQLSNQEPNTPVRSAQVRLQGHEAPIPVSASDGFEIRNVTADNAAGAETWGGSVTVAPGETIQIRTTSGDFDTVVTGTVTAGTRSVTWRVTTRAADILPNAFALPAINGIAPAALAEIPDVVTISGVDVPVAVSSQVLGGTAGTVEFQINGGAWVGSGAIAAGQTLKVRAIAPQGYAEISDIRVSVGSRQVTWRIATTAGNVTPAGIAPAPITNAIPSMVYYSERFVIDGLDSPATLRVSTANCYLLRYNANGSQSLNNQSMVYANGQTLQLRYLSSASPNTTTTCTITIDGGGSFTFRITTTTGQPGSFTIAVPNIDSAEFGASYPYSFTVEDLPAPVLIQSWGRSFSGSTQSAAEPNLQILVNGSSVGSGKYIQNGDEVTITTINGTITEYFGGVGTLSVKYGDKTVAWTSTITDGLKSSDPVSMPTLALVPGAIHGRHVVTAGFDGYARVEALDPEGYVRGRTGTNSAAPLGPVDPTSTSGMTKLAGNRAGDLAILQVRAPSAASFPFGAAGSYSFRIGSQVVTWPWQAIDFVGPGAFSIDDLTLPTSGSTVTTPVAGFTPSNGPFTITASTSRAGVTPVVLRRSASSGSTQASTSFDQTHDGVAVRLTRSQFPSGTATMITLTVSSAYAPDYSTSFLVTAP